MEVKIPLPTKAHVSFAGTVVYGVDAKEVPSVLSTRPKAESVKREREFPSLTPYQTPLSNENDDESVIGLRRR